MSAEAVVTLSDARDDFSHNVMSAMYPHVFGIIDTYAADVRNAGGKTADFQRRLQEIPCWNQAVIDRLANQILVANTEFTHLLRSLFVSYARVLIFRRRPGMPSNVRIMAPTNSKFVHAVMVHVACYVFEHPLAYNARTSADKATILTTAIQDATRQQLPLKDLLQLYLGENINTDDLTPALQDHSSPSPGQDDDGLPADDDNNDERVGSAIPQAMYGSEQMPSHHDVGAAAVSALPDDGGFDDAPGDTGEPEDDGAGIERGGDNSDGEGDPLDRILTDDAIAGFQQGLANDERQQNTEWQAQYGNVQDKLPSRGGMVKAATAAPPAAAASTLAAPVFSPPV